MLDGLALRFAQVSVVSDCLLLSLLGNQRLFPTLALGQLRQDAALLRLRLSGCDFVRAPLQPDDLPLIDAPRQLGPEAVHLYLTLRMVERIPHDLPLIQYRATL
jgi:hypothetical protein